MRPHQVVSLVLLLAFCAVVHAQSNRVGFSSLPKSAQNKFFDTFTQRVPGLSRTQLAKLTSSNGETRDQFGISGGISGNTVVVGMDNYGRNYVYVFVKPSSGWGDMTEIAELTPSDGGNNFGTSVAIDGDTIAVGSRATIPTVRFMYT